MVAQCELHINSMYVFLIFYCSFAYNNLVDRKFFFVLYSAIKYAILNYKKKFLPQSLIKKFPVDIFVAAI